MIIVFGSNNVTRAEATKTTQMKIEAAGNVNYDMETNWTTASKDVILTKDDITIECQRLTYNGKTGEVQASGKVKITTRNYVYQTETLIFNLNQETGNFIDFQGKIKGNSLDYQLSGKGGSLKGDTGTISKAVMTRCPNPNPDYVLTAKRLDYNNKRVYLHHAVLKVKKIPVFYFPRLSFKTDNNDLPDVEVRYDQEEGYQMDMEYAGPVKNDRVWLFKGGFSTKGTNLVGFGVNQYFGKQVNNYTNLVYDFSGFWELTNTLDYGTRLSSLSLDGIKEFSNEGTTEVTISLTRKYWETPIGRWQFGLLARDVFALDSVKEEYGGTYWGYRLDYNPSKSIFLSYLWLDSNKTNEDFRDFLDDYKLGRNYLYNVNLPISKSYSFNLSGTYNSDIEENWISRLYMIKYENCCFRLSAGWNDISESWEMNAKIKF